MPTVWDNVSPPRFPSLSQDLVKDVCVVGAGISGLTIAYTLLREGKSVVVLDSSELGRGETGLTSAHLSNALDNRYFQLEKDHGKEGARLAAESHAAAISRIAEISKAEKIDCEFEWVNGYLFSHDRENLQELEQEFDAATRAGLAVGWEDRSPWPSFNTGRSIRFPDQAQFHPLKYLFGLAKAIEVYGGKIFTHTRALEFEKSTRLKIKTDQDHTLAVGSLVLATNVPVNDRVVVHIKQAAYRSYVIGLKVPKGSVPHGLYWDTDEPYHYVRVQSDADNYDNEILLVGGEDHKTGQMEDYDQQYKNLEEWARHRFPECGTSAFQWSGQIIEPADGLAYIGRNPMDKDDVYIVTGDSGNGLTHGTIAGMLIPDLILGRKNPWESLYDPSRTPKISEMLKENINVVPQYTDWVKPGEVSTQEQIPVGSGKIIQQGLHKIAAYRNKEGKLTQCSAVCPHLGCIVRWNSAESTWDCPCHGSRFSPEGDVINGPANSGLEPINDKVK